MNDEGGTQQAQGGREESEQHLLLMALQTGAIATC